jgi:hypothetical protein
MHLAIWLKDELNVMIHGSRLSYKVVRTPNVITLEFVKCCYLIVYFEATDNMRCDSLCRVTRPPLIIRLEVVPLPSPKVLLPRSFFR